MSKPQSDAGSPPADAPRRSIAELQAGDRVDMQTFRVQQKDLRTTNNGSLYIHAVLADCTGQMLARLWNASQELYDSIPEGGLVRARGRVESYKGAKQFIMDALGEVAPGSVDPADFLPCSPHDLDVLWNRVKEVLRTVENRDLLALLGRFVNDGEFVRQFRRAPAAIQFHHAYVGGLLEHTHNLLNLAVTVCPLYPQVSRDLVLAGIFFHDAGKVRELGYDTNFEYTTEGQLLGHITQGVLWIHDRCRELERETGRAFPAAIETALKHIVLSHHGSYEFGSPRLPMTPEAVMVHYLDNLDAKLNMVFDAIDADRDAAAQWTGFVRALETKVYKVDVMGVRSRPAPGISER